MDEIRNIEPEEAIITETHSSPEPMRQPDFECHIEDSEATYRDFYGAVFGRRNAAMTIAYFAYCAILFAVSMILYGKTDLFFTIAIVLIFAASVFFYFKNKSAVKKSIERIKYASGEKISPINVYFYGDEIVNVNDDPDKTSAFKYEDVKAVRDAGNTRLIEVKNKLCLLVSKDPESKDGAGFDDYILSKATGMKKKKIKKMNGDNTLAAVFLALNAALAAVSVVLYFVL